MGSKPTPAYHTACTGGDATVKIHFRGGHFSQACIFILISVFIAQKLSIFGNANIRYWETHSFENWAIGAIRNSLGLKDDIRKRISIFSSCGGHTFLYIHKLQGKFGPQPTKRIPSEKCLLEFQPGVSGPWKYECSEWTSAMK